MTRRRDDIDLDALAERLAPKVANLVFARLATVLGAANEPYSTRDGDAHAPPEYRGRAKRWRQDAPLIPGATRLGRWWTVPRAAYAAWLTKQSAPSSEPAQVRALSEEWTPRKALLSVGLRAVEGGRK